MLLVLRIHIEQLGHLTTFYQMFLNNTTDILGFHLSIESIVGHNLNDRTFLAETEATGLNHLHLVLKVLLLKNILEVFDNIQAVAGFASSTATDENVHFKFCHT